MRSYRLSSTRLSVVSQDNLLFSTTIKENLFFGLDFVPSEKDINKCLKNACLDEIISVGDLEKEIILRDDSKPPSPLF